MKRNDFSATRYPASQFNWEGRHGSTEMSDLCQGAKGSPFGRVYDDACDVGLTLVGRTRDVTFVITNTKKDHEGDLMFYELTSISEPGFSITIFND